jgi:hypothetical protein
MNRLEVYGLVAVIIFISGYGLGHHAKTISDNAAIVKQVMKVTKIDSKNEAQVEKQNDSDKLKIQELQGQLIAARAVAASHGVPKPSQHRCVSEAQGDAGALEAARADGESARRYEEAYRRLRDELLTSGAVAEQLRLQVLSCQTQWPR